MNDDYPDPTNPPAGAAAKPLDEPGPVPSVAHGVPLMAQGVPQPSNSSSTAEAIRAAGDADAARLSAVGTASAAQLSAGADRVETTARWEGGTLASVETKASHSQSAAEAARAELDALIASGQHVQMAAAAAGAASASGALGRLTRAARVAEHQATEKKLAETRATFDQQRAEIAQCEAELSDLKSTYVASNDAQEHLDRCYARISEANRQLRDAEDMLDYASEQFWIQMRLRKQGYAKRYPAPLERAPPKYDGLSMPPAAEEQLRAHALAPEQRGAVLEAQADEYIQSKVALAEAEVKDYNDKPIEIKAWLNRWGPFRPKEKISLARQEAQVLNPAARPHARRPSTCHALFPHAVNAAAANTQAELDTFYGLLGFLRSEGKLPADADADAPSCSLALLRHADMMPWIFNYSDWIFNYFDEAGLLDYGPRGGVAFMIQYNMLIDFYHLAAYMWGSTDVGVLELLRDSDVEPELPQYLLGVLADLEPIKYAHGEVNCATAEKVNFAKAVEPLKAGVELAKSAHEQACAACPDPAAAREALSGMRRRAIHADVVGDVEREEAIAAARVAERPVVGSPSPVDRWHVQTALPKLIRAVVTSCPDDRVCTEALDALLEVLRSATVPIGLPATSMCGPNIDVEINGLTAAECLAKDLKNLAGWFLAARQPAYGFDAQSAVTPAKRFMRSIPGLVRVWQLMMRDATDAALRNDLAELVLRLVALGGKNIRDVLFGSPDDFDASPLVLASEEQIKRSFYYSPDQVYVFWGTKYPKGLGAFQMLARVYSVYASDELKARAFAKVADVWRPAVGYQPHSSYARDAYIKLVPVKLMLGAFQQCPTRGLPNNTVLAEVAALCGHTHLENAAAVLKALAVRMQQYREWRIDGTNFTRLGRVIDFLYSPRDGTLKAFPPALARLTAPPPPANALAVQPAAAQPAGAVPLPLPPPAAHPVTQPALAQTAAAVPLALPPPQLRPWERIMRRVDCAKCLVASDPGPDGVAARAAYGTLAECGNGKTRDTGRMRACPLAAHALPREAAKALLASHPEPRKRKLDAFMEADFGVGAPLGKKPFAVPLYRAATAAGGYEKEPGPSSGGNHKRVHMGFYIAGEGNGGEAAGSGASVEAGPSEEPVVMERSDDEATQAGENMDELD